MFQNTKRQATPEFLQDPEPNPNLTSLSDRELFNLCKQFGGNALKWRWKFAGLLPEVNRRLLYEKKGFSSIFEFGAKLAGMSREQVSRTLNLEKNFEDKPALKSILVNGEVSINKLARIASIATIDNQEDLAEYVKTLSKNAIEAFVKDEKQSMRKADQDGLKLHKTGIESVPGHKDSNYLKILEALSEKSKNELLDLVEKSINIEELIAEMLNNRRAGIAIAKEQIAAEMEQEERVVPGNAGDSEVHLQGKRYIPVKIRKIIKREYGTKCAVPTCNKPAAIVHHTQRFALAKNHNPYFLAPLCRGHHEIAHKIDVKCEYRRTAAG
jgi:hypothetical protein